VKNQAFEMCRCAGGDSDEKKSNGSISCQHRLHLEVSENDLRERQGGAKDRTRSPLASAILPGSWLVSIRGYDPWDLVTFV
jgi:hypothetical protein